MSPENGNSGTDTDSESGTTGPTMAGRVPADEVWAGLASVHSGDQPPRFDPATVAELPRPARRLLLRALPNDAPLYTAARLRMRGAIKFGQRWLRFSADQLLRSGQGFVWRPVVGGRFLRFTGADLLDGAQARMDFRLHGVIPVARAAGPQVARSAAGRLAAETVLWLPQALTPQAGAVWRPVDEHRAVVRPAGSPGTGSDVGADSVGGAGAENEVVVTVGDDGRLRSLCLQRWNDAATPAAVQPFGGPVDDEFLTNDGVRVAGSGSGGWGWETPSWPDGEFFRYTIETITNLDLGRPGAGIG